MLSSLLLQKPCVTLAMFCSVSSSSWCGISRSMHLKISFLPSLFGTPISSSLSNSTWASQRLINRLGSICRGYHHDFSVTAVDAPSISVSSVETMRLSSSSTSLNVPSSPLRPSRRGHIASISSINIIEGCSSSALLNTSRKPLSDFPTYLLTNSGRLWRRNSH